jgi:hypothetical protein
MVYRNNKSAVLESNGAVLRAMRRLSVDMRETFQFTDLEIRVVLLQERRRQ